MTPPPELSISATFTAMKEGAVRNRSVLVRITFLFALLQSASVLLELGGTAGFALSAGLSVLLGNAYRGMVTVQICMPGPIETGSELWTLVRPILARLIWAGILITVATLAGLFLLIVPGLFLLTIWSVVIPVIVSEKLSLTDSFRRSSELVRGNGWRVFGFMMLLSIAGALVVLVIVKAADPLGSGTIQFGIVVQFLIACLFNPIVAIGPAALYNQLTIPPEDPPAEPPATEPRP